MKSEQILDLKVVDIASGSNIGTVRGILIDAENKRMIALQLEVGFLSNPGYVSFDSIKAIENDVVMIESESSVVARGTFKDSGIVEKLVGRKVLTVEGKDIGTVHEYDIDILSGDLKSVSVAMDIPVLGGLWKNSGEIFDVPISKIVTLGESILVDKSVKDPMAAHKVAS